MPIGRIDPFDMNSKQWPAYVRRVKQFILLNEIKDELKVPTLITVVGEATYALMCDLCAPKHPEDMTFDLLVDLVTNHLEPQRSEIAERHVFRARRQHQGETLTDYLQHLKHLAATCNFGTRLEENLRDQFVSGLASDVMRSRIFAKKNINYALAVELALALEAADRHAEVSGASGNRALAAATDIGVSGNLAGDNLHAVRGRSGGARAAFVAGSGDGMGAGALRNNTACWRCGKAHRPNKCRFVNYNCDECNQRGHLKVMCDKVRNRDRDVTYRRRQHFMETFQEVIETPKAVVGTESHRPNYSHVVASAILSLAAILVMAIVFNKLYCRRADMNKDDISGGADIEKGDVMGSGSECLATGLLCVDNLTLAEHIGQGKFGSVWQGTLGSSAVAVKLYSHSGAWQKETAIYTLPHLTHANLLRYYGSDSRPSLSEGGCREHLIVLELCERTLRSRLEEAPVSWLEFATLAHGIASALAHLHTPLGSKPCIVHRDINSNNVLLTRAGQAKLADLDLAVPLYTRYYRDQCAPSRITEAGTLRYLSPEALEGALDLSGARAALCAVDVFALALVLWELLWRCAGAHPPHTTPPYAPPYHPHVPADVRPTLAQMQSLVSRNKARPPLPAGPVPEARALKIATDTCDECWDHDAEARLTAVCVEERMAELKMMLLAQGPVIHDNNLHCHPNIDPSVSSPTDADKNSNCTSTQTSDVKTPLLYPPHPHIGRNACIERNTHTNTQTHTVELIHKSLKDISLSSDTPRVHNVEEHCLSVARVNHQRTPVQENSDRFNEIRSYQRPLDYVQNDVSNHDTDRGPKETNLQQDIKSDKPKWGIRKFFERKLKNNKGLQTEVKLVTDVSNGSRIQNGTVTSVVNDKPINVNFERPANLVLNEDITYNFETPCTLSPPNRTLSPTMLIESQMNRSENKVFKRLPSDETDTTKQNQIFAVIVPKAKPTDYSTFDMRNKESGSRGSSESIIKQSIRTSMSSQSFFKSSNSESEDSTVKKRLSCDNRIISNASNSGRSSRASVNLELRYIDNNPSETYNSNSPYDMNSDCSSSEDEHLMLLSENGGSKITMQAVSRNVENDKKKYQNEVLKETGQTKSDFVFNKQQYKYKNFDNEFSDPQDKENVVNGFSVDNPVYLATINGEINPDLKYLPSEEIPKSPKPALKNLVIKRQHSLEQVNDIFTSTGDIHLLNPAGRVKTPGDLPVAVRRARRDRALQKGRANESNRLSLYDDRMMFGNSL